MAFGSQDDQDGRTHGSKQQKMKKSQIVILLVVFAIAAVLIGTFTSSVDNVCFVEAEQLREKVKVVGVLDKTKGIEYDAEVNPNLTTFHVVDQKGECRKVQLNDKQGRPMGLEQSETVTLEGEMDAAGVFQANFMLMKCPSKYNEQKHSLSADNK
jgi:cytochrome c-type biogenesis protein CcmE